MEVSISSNTIVRNGMPFIGKVLRQVVPYMEKMIIHYSVKSNDGTLDELMSVYHDYSRKIIITREDVDFPAQLTGVRNEQVKMTNSDWILFLDDDDYWKREDFEKCLEAIKKEPHMRAFSVSPYQMIDWKTYDANWLEKKSFSKFLKNDGLRYIKPWPRDLPVDKDGKQLYWKKHPLVKRLPFHYYHLPHLKTHSFRSEEWADKFIYKVGRAAELNQPLEI